MTEESEPRRRFRTAYDHLTTSTTTPVIMGVPTGWIESAARKSVLRGVLQNFPWMPDLFYKFRSPLAYRRHLDVNLPKRERRIATLTWATHQLWRQQSRRVGAMPAVYWNMLHCTPAGVRVATPKFITCKQGKFCPWCHQRRIIKFIQNLPALKAGEHYAVCTHLAKPSNEGDIPSVAELRAAAEWMSHIRDLMPDSETRILRLLRFHKSDAYIGWGVTTLAATVIGPATTPPARFKCYGKTHFVYWQLHRNAWEFAGLAADILAYPYQLLDTGMSKATIAALFRLSKQLRDSTPKPKRSPQPTPPPTGMVHGSDVPRPSASNGAAFPPAGDK